MVAIPISFQLIFLFVIAFYLQAAEKELAEENRRKALALYCHEIQNQFYRSGVAMKAFKSTRDVSNLQRFRNYKLKVDETLKTMSELINHKNIDEENLFINFKNATNKGIDSLNHHFEVMIAVGSGSETGPEMEFGLFRFLYSAHELLHQIEPKKSPQESAKERQQVIYIMYAGCAINIVIGFALVYMFAGGTVKRLRVLMENTQRLSKHEELLGKVGGSDEIAHLDSVFHDMAKSLDEAARHKQELVQMVSHDLKTPLSSVQMSLSSMADGVYGDLPTPVLKQIQISEFNVTRLMHLIRDLLDIDRLEAGKLDMDFQTVDVSTLLNQSITAVQAYAERSKIKIVPSETTAKIEADSDRLVQVLVNLLSNAIKYAPKNSTVSINTIERDNNVEIQVIDKGKGIPSQYLSVIFDRFQQVSKTDASQHKGTGLGLAIAKAIVAAHHGEIGVDSKEGDGSTFWFRLPVRQVSS